MQPRTYEVRVSGLVPSELVEGLDVAEVSTEPVHTVIRTAPSDQPALLGLLERLRAMGVELLEVRQLSEDTDETEADVIEADVIKANVIEADTGSEPSREDPAPTGSAGSPSTGPVPAP